MSNNKQGINHFQNPIYVYENCFIKDFLEKYKKEDEHKKCKDGGSSYVDNEDDEEEETNKLVHQFQHHNHQQLISGESYQNINKSSMVGKQLLQHLFSNCEECKDHSFGEEEEEGEIEEIDEQNNAKHLAQRQKTVQSFLSGERNLLDNTHHEPYNSNRHKDTMENSSGITSVYNCFTPRWHMDCGAPDNPSTSPLNVSQRDSTSLSNIVHQQEVADHVENMRNEQDPCEVPRMSSKNKLSSSQDQVSPSASTSSNEKQHKKKNVNEITAGDLQLALALEDLQITLSTIGDNKKSPDNIVKKQKKLYESMKRGYGSRLLGVRSSPHVETTSVREETRRFASNLSETLKQQSQVQDMVFERWKNTSDIIEKGKKDLEELRKSSIMNVVNSLQMEGIMGSPQRGSGKTKRETHL